MHCADGAHQAIDLPPPGQRKPLTQEDEWGVQNFNLWRSMTQTRKKVVAQLPPVATEIKTSSKYAWEMEALSALDVEIVEAPTDSVENFLNEARDAHALMVSWGIRIDQQVIASLEKCVVISSGSVGVDNIDVEAATAAGIVVTNVPDVFIEETADHTLMLLLAIYRRITTLDAMVRRGDWKKGRSVLAEFPRLRGQTLGIFAFGNIATAVARRAKPFGLNVIAHDPYVSELKMIAEGVEPVSMQELLARADFLTLHPALNPETRGIFSEAQFSAMKNTAILVNCGRGEVVDEAALIRALEKGEIAAAGLDVLEKEPPDLDNPLFGMENVILTPHSASASSRMRPTARRRVGRELALVLSGKWPMSAVNPTVLPRVNLERWQPYPMQRGPNR